MTTTLLPLSLHYWTKPPARAKHAWRSSSKGFSRATTHPKTPSSLPQSHPHCLLWHVTTAPHLPRQVQPCLQFPKTQQLSFPKQAYRVFLRRRFGMAIPQIPLRRCVCKSKPELDRIGTHLVCMCPKGRERFITHDSMAICIRDMAKAAGAYAKFENSD